MRCLVLWILAILAGVIAVAPRVSSGSTATYKDIIEAEDDYWTARFTYHEKADDLVMEVGGLMGDMPVKGRIDRDRDHRCVHAVLIGMMVLGAFIFGGGLSKDVHSPGTPVASAWKWTVVATIVVVVCAVAFLVGLEFWYASSRKAEVRPSYERTVRRQENRAAEARERYIRVLKEASEGDLMRRQDRARDDEIRRMLEEELERRKVGPAGAGS